jgi:hypothetical protein
VEKWELSCRLGSTCTEKEKERERERESVCVCVSGAVGASQRRVVETSPRVRRRLKVAVGARQVKLSRVY